ncbi:hypothetical protein [Paraburkholderia caledonica]|uniref:hypothetical protein n=1 Tax=Paraburkholderia caledonica TaxID=134536 RepID=UPI0011779930|nr:hypothetical protein [Paraburkholderia caledonica]
MTTSLLANGDELLHVIEMIAELEWRKFQAREVEVVLKSGEIYREDNSRIPPFTSFRFKNESAEQVSAIDSAVIGYAGSIAWQMSAHSRISLPGRNWLIRPAFVNQMAIEAGNGMDVGRYIAENFPHFAAVAYADLLGLAKHVRNALVK